MSTTITRLYVPWCGVGSEVAGGVMAGWDEVHGVEISIDYVEQGLRRVPRLIGEFGP